MESSAGYRDSAPPAPPPHRDAVLAELERILASPAFRGTKRSQEFLRYVVVNSLEGRTDCLKERSIGIEVFGRAPDYATGDDSIVRVKASEVRKRLAQFYRDAGEDTVVQIDLPAGSYAPEFRFRDVPAEAPPPVPRRSLQKWLLVSAAVAALGGAAAWQVSREVPAIDAFWNPMFQSGKPVLLCVANPPVYRLQASSRDALDAGAVSVPARELARDTEHYVGFGDALALANFTFFLARAGKPAQSRIGSDISFADLRGSPAVLIGAFTNQWTMEMTSQLRFAFERLTSGVVIRDRLTSQVWSTQASRDYAVVTRMFESPSGNVMVAAAGLSHYGTQMAGEFLVNRERMEQAMAAAPPDWRKRNLQLVLEADVIGRTPGPPRLVASYFW